MWMELFQKFDWYVADPKHEVECDRHYRGDCGGDVITIKVGEEYIFVFFYLKYTNPEGVPLLKMYGDMPLDGSIINLIPLVAFLAREAKTK